MSKSLGACKLNSMTSSSPHVVNIRNLKLKTSPADITALFNNNEVATSYHMSLGSNGSYIFSYKPKTGNGSRVASSGIPTTLSEWLYEKNSSGDCVRSFLNLYVSLGPGNNSWWATDGSSYKWSNLPTPLQKAVDANLKNGSWIDTPKFVTLGVDGDYAMVTKNNAASWRCAKYKPIDQLFDTMKENGTVSLNHVRDNLRLLPV